MLALPFLFAACIKQVDVKTRNAPPILVVEGGITTDSVPYRVKLSYSGYLRNGDNIPDSSQEKNATVSITDDAGHAATLTYLDSGIYQTTDPNYIGVAGRTYSVVIILPNGKKYISAPEKLPPPVPIDKVSAAYVNQISADSPSYANVTVDITDPADQQNYYKWDFYTWMPRKANGIGCGFGCVAFEYCFQKEVSKSVNLLSDEAINGNPVKNQLVGNSHIYWFGFHYIEISQLSLTQQAYQFWQSYLTQQARTGSILDPLPASIRGNVYNAANPADFALGYFSASSATHKRAVLVMRYVSQYLLDISAKQFIPGGPGICFEVFPNTMSYPPSPAPQNPPPPGWENAENIDVFF